MPEELENNLNGEVTVEEKKEYGSLGGHAQHIRISRRDSLMNDLRNGTAQGVFSCVLAFFAGALLIAAIIQSYFAAGASGYEVGVELVFAVAFDLVGFGFSVAGFRDKDKIRHYAEKRGHIACIVIFFLLAAVFVYGLITWLN